MEDEKSFKEVLLGGLRTQWERKPGTILGVLVGIIFAVGILLFGFWSVFFVAVCAGLGCFIGRNVDKGGSFIDNVRDSFPNNIHRWR